jgi:phosphotriesterase-related protein
MGRHHVEMSRRFTRRALLASAAALPLRAASVPNSVLVHEHVMVDFIGADKIAPGRYDPEEVFRIAKSKIEEVKVFGCVRIHECTPNYIGRDARLLRRLADATGVDIWTNTGLYGAANHKYVPKFAYEETAEQLARRWIAEARNGINGIHPRFIKSGVNKGPLDEIDRKLVQAAALASRETGLPVAIHTGDGKAALEEAEIFTAARVQLSKLIWVHAQNEKDHAIHEQLARAGAWVEFDGINARSAAWHEECVRFMASRNLLGRTLISQDSGWYRVGEPGGGLYNGYTYLYTGFLPKLDGAWIRPLLVDNPRAAF